MQLMKTILEYVNILKWITLIDFIQRNMFILIVSGIYLKLILRGGIFLKKKFISIFLITVLMFLNVGFTSVEGSSKNRISKIEGVSILNLTNTYFGEGRAVANLEIKNLVVNNSNIRLVGEIEVEGSVSKINLKGDLSKSQTLRKSLTGDFVDQHDNFEIIHFSLACVNEEEIDHLIHIKEVGKILRLYVLDKSNGQFIVFEGEIDFLRGHKEILNSLLLQYNNFGEDIDTYYSDFWFLKVFEPMEEIVEESEESFDFYVDEDGSMFQISSTGQQIAYYTNIRENIKHGETGRLSSQQLYYAQRYPGYCTLWGIFGDPEISNNWVDIWIRVDHVTLVRNSDNKVFSYVEINNKGVTSGAKGLLANNNKLIVGKYEEPVSMSLATHSYDIYFQEYYWLQANAHNSGTYETNYLGLARNAVNLVLLMSPEPLTKSIGIGSILANGLVNLAKNDTRFERYVDRKYLLSNVRYTSGSNPPKTNGFRFDFDNHSLINTKSRFEIGALIDTNLTVREFSTRFSFRIFHMPGDVDPWYRIDRSFLYSATVRVRIG